MIAAMSASGRRRSNANPVEVENGVTDISNNNLLNVNNGHINNHHLSSHHVNNSRSLGNNGMITNPLNGNIVGNHITDMVSAIKNAIKPKRNQSIYDENSKMLFPVIFFTFATVYWAYYQLTRYNTGSSDCDFD